MAELARALSERSGALIAASEQALVDLERVTRLRVGSRAVRARRCPRVEQLIAHVRDLLVSYRDAFGGFDAVQFPVLAVTGVGEELSPVAVHRIGAGDAPPDEGDPSEKLFGTRFATFGAFLDARWRAHDIVWGRLDGAERLLSVLAGEAHEGARDALVVEAQQAILLEAFPEEAAAVRALPRALPRALAGALARAPGAARADDGGPDRLDPDDGVDADATRRRVRAFMDEKRERLELDPRAAARDLSRLVRVSGRLSDAVTSDADLPRTVKWVLRLAAFAGSNLIDAAVPKTFVHLLTSYWAQLLLLFGALLIVLGGPWVPWWQPLPGGLGWGLGLAAAALAFLLLRALVWRLLARGRSPRRSARAGARTPRGSRPRG